jgi:hypothetical protein
MIKVGLISYWDAENSGECFNNEKSFYSTESSYILLNYLKEYLLEKNIILDSYRKFNFNEIDIFIYRDLPVNPLINSLIKKSNKVKILWQHEIWYLRPESWGDISKYAFNGVITWSGQESSNTLKICLTPHLKANIMTDREFFDAKPIAMINSNRKTNHTSGYALRKMIIDHPNNIVDLYGKGWNRKRFSEDSKYSFLNSKYLDFLFQAKAPETYVSSLKEKKYIKNKYKAHIVIENYIENDYVTEKIWDVLNIGAVPIYLGAPNLKDVVDVNKQFYIDYNKFNSLDSMYSYINNLTYQEYSSYFNNYNNFIEERKNFDLEDISMNIYNFILKTWNKNKI